MFRSCGVMYSYLCNSNRGPFEMFVCQCTMHHTAAENYTISWSDCPFPEKVTGYPFRWVSSNHQRQPPLSFVALVVRTPIPPAETRSSVHARPFPDYQYPNTGSRIPEPSMIVSRKRSRCPHDGTVAQYHRGPFAGSLYIILEGKYANFRKSEGVLYLLQKREHPQLTGLPIRAIIAPLQAGVTRC